MVYFYKQYTQPTFQYSTPSLSDYSSTQTEKERHEGTFEDGCRMNNRWLAYTIKKIYALVQVQIHNTHTFIFREGMWADTLRERECVYDRGLFQDYKMLFVIAHKVFTRNHMTVV